MKKSVLFERLFYNLLAILYSWSVIFSLNYSLNLCVGKLKVFYICVVFMLIFNIWFFNKITTISCFLISLGAFSYYIHNIIETELYMEYYKKLYRFAEWFYHFIILEEPLDERFGFYIVLFIGFATCIYAFMAFVKKFWLYSAFFWGVFYSFSMAFLGYNVYFPGIVVYIFCMVCMFARNAYRRKIISADMIKSGPEYQYVLWSIPLALIIALSTSVFSRLNWLPDWKYRSAGIYVPGWVETNFRRFIKWYNSSDKFSFIVTGFQPNRQYLGGNITLDDSLVMNVNSNNRIYLKGSIRDYYTGKGWISTSNKQYIVKDQNISNYITDSSFSEEEHFLQFQQKMPSFNFNNELYNQVFINGFAEIQQVNFKNNIIFYPENIVSMNHWSYNNKSIYTNDNGEFYFSGRPMPDHYYIYHYRIFNKFHPYAKQLLNSSTPDVIKPLLDNNPYLLEKYNDIIKKYTNRDNIPSSVADLAKQITSSKHTRYEKVQALEEYLSANYRYTLSPGYPPEGKDFVEYFLFDAKKGYCSYYASAMTVMARSLGIPARYVEGYVLPATCDNSGIYRVTNDLSHAWVEVFFEGLGWIQFEPTAPFYALNNQQDVRQTFADDAGVEENRQEEYISRLMGETTFETAEETDTYPTEVPEQREAESLSKNDSNKAVVYFLITFVFIIAVILFRRLIFENNIRKVLNIAEERNVAVLYKRILQMMKLYHQNNQRGETLLEFATRVNEHLPQNIGNFEEITRLYLKARFGKLKLEKDERQKIMNFYHAMVLDLKHRLNMFQWLYYRYVLLMF